MIIDTETRNNFAWYSDSCPEDYDMFDTESINLSQNNRNTDRVIMPNYFNQNDWQIADPGQAGFSNTQIKGVPLPNKKEVKAVTKLDLHKLPELIIFSDWETTFLKMPTLLVSSKTTNLIFSAQFSKLQHRYD